MRVIRVLMPVILLLLLALLLMPSCTRDNITSEETIYRESPPIVGAARKSAYARPEGSAPFPVTAPLIVLRGTWHGMGGEYGRRATYEIRQVYEGLFQDLAEVGLDGRALNEALARCRALSEELAPEMLEFMEGIAEGCSPELQKSPFGAGLTAEQKVLMINFFPSLYENAPGFEGALQEEGSAWECRGTFTQDGATLAGANIDAAFYPFMYRLALMVVPDDPESFYYFSLPVAGCVGGPVGINQEGLVLSAIAVKPASSSQAAEASGDHSEISLDSLPVPASLLTTLALTKSRDLRSAQEALLYGPHDIAAGGEVGDLVNCTSSNFLICDSRSAQVIERDLLHYGLRGEEQSGGGGIYLACTDNFTAPESYASGGEPTSEPMSAYGSPSEEIPSSVVRLRSLATLFQSSAAPINPAWMMTNINRMNYTYDEQGQRSYQVTNILGEIVSCYESGLTVERYLPYGDSAYFGTVCSFVADPASLEVWFELGLPSDWVGPWEHINLGDYQR